MTGVRPVPYPADTRARGWRFEIDYEKVDQSDTWPLAAEVPMAQHALLMMWLVAWTQEPCGSLPNDEALIRAKCKIPPKFWPTFRDVLMRGWWLAEDGRLYHDTITVRVLAMLDKRASDAQRSANRRARQAEAAANPPEVTPASRVTPPGLQGEFDTKHLEPSTSSIPPKPPRKRRGGAAALLVSVETMVGEGVQQRHAEDWLAVRATKKLPLTQTAWDAVKEQAAVAKLSLDAAIRTAAVNGWGGFKAKWLAELPLAGPGAAPAITVSSDAAAITKAQQEAEASRLADPAAQAAANAARIEAMKKLGRPATIGATA